MPKQPDPQSQPSSVGPERLATLLALVPSVATTLRAATDRDGMQAALTPVTALPATEQLALATALGGQRGKDAQDAVDLAEALAELGTDRPAAKEARRAVIRQRSAGARPDISVPKHTTVVATPDAGKHAEPEFITAWASRTRERSEVQLAMLWTRPHQPNDVDGFVLALNFWEGRIDNAVHVEPMSQRRFEREIVQKVREEGHFTWVSIPLPQVRALIEDALDQQVWRAEPLTAEWREVADVILRRVQHADVVADPSVHLALLDPESDAEETLVNFWGSWCFGDFGLAYDLLGARNAIRDQGTRAEFIALRRQWFDEAHTARFQLGAIVPQTAEQSGGLWLPGSVQSAQQRTSFTMFWSVELQETPLAGQLPEMPFATLTNAESSRHWYWQTVTMEHDANFGIWRLARIRDDALDAQAQPAAALLQRSETLWDDAEKLVEANGTEEDVARETALKVIAVAQESLSWGESALMRLPADRELHEKLHDRAAQLALWDRAAAVTQRMLVHFPDDQALFQRDLASLDFRRAQTYAEADDEASYARWLDFAITASRAALELDRTAEALVILAELILAKGDVDEAEGMLRESIALHESVGAWADLGDLLMRQQKPREAIDAFERAHRLDPGTPQIRWRLGRALELADRLGEARLVYEDALAVDGEDAMAHALLGNVLIEQKDFDAANTHLEQALQLGLASAQIFSQLAYIAAQRHEFDHARALLNQAARIDPSIANDVRQLITQINAEEAIVKKAKGR